MAVSKGKRSSSNSNAGNGWVVLDNNSSTRAPQLLDENIHPHQRSGWNRQDLLLQYISDGIELVNIKDDLGMEPNAPSLNSSTATASTVKGTDGGCVPKTVHGAGQPLTAESLCTLDFMNANQVPATTAWKADEDHVIAGIMAQKTLSAKPSSRQTETSTWSWVAVSSGSHAERINGVGTWAQDIVASHWGYSDHLPAGAIEHDGEDIVLERGDYMTDM